MAKTSRGSRVELVINQVFSGLVRASLYFLVTSGLTLLFGVVGTLNMAHFSLYMIASYLTWTFHNYLIDYSFSDWPCSSVRLWQWLCWAWSSREW